MRAAITRRTATRRAPHREHESEPREIRRVCNRPPF
nr:MAG TPA: hypothetical protein [Caudoviricetes sp.]